MMQKHTYTNTNGQAIAGDNNEFYSPKYHGAQWLTTYWHRSQAWLSKICRVVHPLYSQRNRIFERALKVNWFNTLTFQMRNLGPTKKQTSHPGVSSRWTGPRLVRHCQTTAHSSSCHNSSTPEESLMRFFWLFCWQCIWKIRSVLYMTKCSKNRKCHFVHSYLWKIMACFLILTFIWNSDSIV